MCPLNVTTNSIGCVAESRKAENRVCEGCPLSYIFIIFLCMFFMIEALILCLQSQIPIHSVYYPVYWNFCVFMCVSESKEGKFNKGSELNQREKVVRWVSLKLSAGRCIAVLFQTVYFFAILQPCLDNVNCRVLSVLWLTHFWLPQFTTIHFNRMPGLQHFSETSKMSQSEDSWALL